MKKLSLIIILFPLFSFSQVWNQMGQDILGESNTDLSGVYVSLSNDGETVVIGGHFNDGGGSNSGHVRVFEWDGSDWIQKGNDIDGEAAGDNFGISADINGNGDVVIVGAYQNDGNGAESGAAYVYEWNGSAWIQKGADIDGEFAGDYCGLSVSTSSDGDVIAVGSYFNDNTAAFAGSTRIYEWNGSAWIQKGTSINGEAFGDNAGFSVSLNAAGSRVGIGAWANNDGGSDAGQTRVYDWNGSAWVQLDVDIDGQNASDHSGYSVSLNTSGSILAVGEPGNDDIGTDGGQVKVYSFDGTNWIQQGSTIPGLHPGDAFGHAVALDGTGNRMIIGADKSDTTGIDAGEVRVYDYAAGWTQFGETIVGGGLGDWLGTSVDISTDGTTIALGEPNFDGTGTDKGRVRIYRECSGYFVDSTISWNATNLSLEAMTAGYEYQWVDCANGNTPIPGETNQEFFPQLDGEYAVIISDGVCSKQSFCLIVDVGLSISEKPALSISAYPNPATDFLTLDFNQIVTNATVIVRDALGRQVNWSQHNQTQKIDVDLIGTTGIYFIEIQVQGFPSQQIKVVKK